MPTCPNCSYKLVLLSNRRKYKCAKCSRLFLTKFIESKDFQIWNKKQKELDLHNLKLEIQQGKKPKLNSEERLQRWEEWRTKYYEENKERIFANVKEWRDKNKEKKRQHDRMGRWRKEQKFLALQALINNEIRIEKIK